MPPCMPVVLAALLAATLAAARADTPITVSAAASLTDALQDAGRAYERSGGGRVRFNFAGSNVIARQVANGAPVDLFISADEPQMQVARKAGAIVESTLVNLLGNRLAVVTPRGRSHAIRDADALAGPAVKRLALGDPEAVPVGVYARRYLETLGVWNAVASRVVPVSNPRAALSAVESGAVDAAIVYESDTVTARAVDVAFVVEGPAAPVIVYPAAIVSASRNKRAAARFLEFLRGEEAAAIFRSYRFTPLAR